MSHPQALVAPCPPLLECISIPTFSSAARAVFPLSTPRERMQPAVCAASKNWIPLGKSWLTPRRCATRPGSFGDGGRLGRAQPATISNPCEAPQALRSQPRLSQRYPIFLRRPQALVEPRPLFWMRFGERCALAKPHHFPWGGAGGETRLCGAGNIGED